MHTPLPKNTIDLTGKTYGRLLVLGYYDRASGGHARWSCRCECGGESIVVGCALRLGRIVSCGCYRADPITRQAARLKTPRRRRLAIAYLGGAARAAKD